MRKFIAMLLTFVMVISVLPVYASKTAEQEFSTEKIKGEVIIPFTDAETEGEYKPSTVVKGYDGGAHYWGYKAVTYNLEKIKKGRYELFFWVCPHPVCKKTLEFEILHADETAKAVVHQSTDEGETVEPGWVSLGVYEFSGDGTECVKMADAGSTTRQSAIKYAPTDKDVTVAEPEPEPEVKEEDVSGEAVPVIGEKKPDPTSKLKDIEVLPAGKCTWKGDWKFSTAVTGPMVEYPSSMWIAGVGEEATVTYNPRIEAVGDVNIFVYLLWWHENQNPQVKYEVHHNGKVDTVMLDPTTLTESSWVYLGTFDFAGDIENEFVKLVCQKDEKNAKGNTRASTVMFEIVNSEGGIWQTKYATPYVSIETMIENGEMAALNKFEDMKDHWAHYDVEYMANEGLISGVSENSFNPDAQITRAEYLTILDRAMGYEEVKEDFFADVTSDAWYYGYVGAAKKNGLIEGLPTDDGFKPTQPITRQEMALFTYNAIQQIGRNDEWLADMPDDYAKFTDTAEVADWAEEALKYLIKTGIIKGTTETTVSALENATRAQGAVILKRFMSYFVWAGPPTDQEWVMTFNDEFNGNEMDWSVWRSESKAASHIQSSRWPENVEVHDGAVHLVIRHEEREGKEWTAGSVWVRPEVFAQKYGYWEARYKIAASKGINNSFWTYSSHTHNIHRETGTGKHFELDINEGHYPNTVNMTYHSDFETGKSKSYSSTYVSPYDLSADYHTYALEWTPEELKFYHDGVLRSTQKNLNADQLQFPYLSSAVLNWAGQATSQTHGTAQIVDYVRIWQKKEDVDNPELNFKGEPMVGVGPAEQKPGGGTAEVPGLGAPDSSSAGTATDVVEFKTTTETFKNEVVVKYEDAIKVGVWKSSSVVKGYDDKVHYWAGTSGSITYNAEGLKKGKYDVYYWLCPYGSSTAELVNLEINANGESKVVASRQLLNEGETVEAGWVKLGTFDFKADGSEYVKAFPDTGTFRTSAVKFVPVK